MAGCILVVSDDPELEEEARFGLDDDLEVVGAADALTARDVFATITPAAVIVDLRAGNSGGFALARDMSQDPRRRAVPIVIVIEREPDRWLAATAGAAAVLRKPVTAAELKDTLSSLFASKMPA